MAVHQTINIAYHYTSIDIFLKMLNGVKDNLIFFHGSYISYMNDPTEFKYGFNFVHKLLEPIENELLVQRDDRLSIIWNTDDIREQHIDMLTETFKLPFVVCFSNHKDFLPQWEMYGDRGKGVSLGFDVQNYCKIYKTKDGQKILDLTKYNDKEPHALRVSYRNICNRPFIKAALYSMYKNYLEEIKTCRDKEAKCKLQLDVLHSIAFYLSALIKHKAYSYESETRILLPRSKYNDVLFKTNNKGQIVPYINIAIDLKRLKKIVIGPCCCDYDTTKMMIGARLKQLNHKDVKILRSQIPYR